MKPPIHSLPNSQSNGAIPLLPNSKNKTLFISVFNTMIHWSIDRPPHGYDFSVYVAPKQTDSSLYVTLRPGLVKFLRAAVKKARFEIVTFSWWPRDYVSAILDQIDPTGNLITHRLYLDYSVKTGKPTRKMDINRTGRMLDRSVIIDGNQNLYVRPWVNAIKVSPYTGDANDDELCRLKRFLKAQKKFLNLQTLVHVCSVSPVTPDFLLPSTTKKTLFLDLDMTLIYHVSIYGKPPYAYHFTTECSYIIVRPGVDELLQAATDSGFEIVIFTAGDRDYAAPIIDKLDLNGHIAHRLYRDSCKNNKSEAPIKDLYLTGRSLDRCIMIDDIWQRVVPWENVVMIKPFKGDMQDSELTKLLPYFSLERKDENLLDTVIHINGQLGYSNL